MTPNLKVLQLKLLNFHCPIEDLKNQYQYSRLSQLDIDIDKLSTLIGLVEVISHCKIDLEMRHS